MDYSNSINSLKREVELLRRDIETMQAISASGAFFALPTERRQGLYDFLDRFLPNGTQKDTLLSNLAIFLRQPN